MTLQMMNKEIKILAIESSCDETAAAVVVNGRDVRSNVISSQIALHTLYGGVVPEIASRKHIEKINQVIEEALKEAAAKVEKVTEPLTPPVVETVAPPIVEEPVLTLRFTVKATRTKLKELKEFLERNGYIYE